ncbi:MAG: acetate uptake transporter [Candidatus Diapherotrites archaeon]
MVDLKANPAPLGLMGFGMTTILLNLHNAGLFGLGSMILGMGIFYGGLAQIIAGIMEFKNGNTFGTVAFTSYGLFWLSLVAIWAIPKFSWGTSFANTPVAIGFYLLCWGVFTLMMFFGTLKTNRVLQFVFASLALLFFLLAIGDFTGNKVITQIAGIEGIICGASAFYLAMAEVLNLQAGKTVLPVFPVKK